MEPESQASAQLFSGQNFPVVTCLPPRPVISFNRSWKGRREGALAILSHCWSTPKPPVATRLARQQWVFNYLNIAFALCFQPGPLSSAKGKSLSEALLGEREALLPCLITATAICWVLLSRSNPAAWQGVWRVYGGARAGGGVGDTEITHRHQPPFTARHTLAWSLTTRVPPLS